MIERRGSRRRRAGPSGELLPVVEAVPRVVRHREQALGERLRRDHLPARRAMIRPSSSPSRPLGRSRRWRRRRSRRSSSSSASTRSCSRISTPASAAASASRLHEPRRLQDAVARMEDRAREPAGRDGSGSSSRHSASKPSSRSASNSARSSARAPPRPPASRRLPVAADRVAAELDHPVDVRPRSGASSPQRHRRPTTHTRRRMPSPRRGGRTRRCGRWRPRRPRARRAGARAVPRRQARARTSSPVTPPPTISTSAVAESGCERRAERLRQARRSRPRGDASWHAR